MEKLNIKYGKHAELWRILYQRTFNLLPDNEKEHVKLSTEIEEVNYLERQDLNDNSEESKLCKESLNTAVSMLNEENLNLKVILQRIEQAHKSESENLRAEIDSLKKLHTNQLQTSLKQEQEKNREIDQLKNKLKHEEQKYDDLKSNFNKEINAIKIRFENELSKQNCIMQQKNDELLGEIKYLNDTLKKCKNENSDLVKELVNQERKLSIISTASYEDRSRLTTANNRHSERKIEINELSTQVKNNNVTWTFHFIKI